MKFLFTVFLITIFTLPLHFALNPAQGYDLMLTRVLGSVLFCGTLLYCLLRRQCSFQFSLQTFFLTSFLVVAALSLFLTEHPLWGARKILFFLTLVPFYFLTIYFVAKRQNVSMLIQKVIVWSGMLIASIGLVQFMLQFIIGLELTMVLWRDISALVLGKSLGAAVIMHNSWLVNVAGVDLFRVIAFFPDPHICAFFFGMIAPLAVGLSIKTGKSFYVWFALLMIIADLLTFSRGGYIGLIVGFSIFIIIYQKQLHVWHKIIGGIFVSVLCLSLIIPSNPVSDRLASSFDMTEGSNTERLANWAQAYDIIVAHPLRGVGLGGYISHVDPRADYRTPIYAHNLYLDIMAEMGVIGLLLWLSFLLTVVIIYFSQRTDPLMVASGISITVFMTHSFFETSLFSVHIFTLLMIIAGLSCHHAISYRHEKTNRQGGELS